MKVYEGNNNVGGESSSLSIVRRHRSFCNPRLQPRKSTALYYEGISDSLYLPTKDDVDKRLITRDDFIKKDLSSSYAILTPSIMIDDKKEGNDLKDDVHGNSTNGNGPTKLKRTFDELTPPDACIPSFPPRMSQLSFLNPKSASINDSVVYLDCPSLMNSTLAFPDF